MEVFSKVLLVGKSLDERVFGFLVGVNLINSLALCRKPVVSFVNGVEIINGARMVIIVGSLWLLKAIALPVVHYIFKEMF